MNLVRLYQTAQQRSKFGRICTPDWIRNAWCARELVLMLVRFWPVDARSH